LQTLTNTVHEEKSCIQSINQSHSLFDALGTEASTSEMTTILFKVCKQGDSQ